MTPQEGNKDAQAIAVAVKARTSPPGQHVDWDVSLKFLQKKKDDRDDGTLNSLNEGFCLGPDI